MKHYTFVVISEHPIIVDIILQYGQVCEQCVPGDTHLCIVLYLSVFTLQVWYPPPPPLSIIIYSWQYSDYIKIKISTSTCMSCTNFSVLTLVYISLPGDRRWRLRWLSFRSLGVPGWDPGDAAGQSWWHAAESHSAEADGGQKHCRIKWKPSVLNPWHAKFVITDSTRRIQDTQQKFAYETQVYCPPSSCMVFYKNPLLWWNNCIVSKMNTWTP